jgi:hypothetical protein
MKIHPDGTIDLEPGIDTFTVGQDTNYKGKNRWYRVRKFSSQLADADNGGGIGIFGKILGGLKKLGGFALSIANALGIQISWSSLWQFLQMTSYTVYNFNWNQSDEEIKEQIESTNNLISNMAGYILGDATIRVVTVAVINGIPIKYPIIPARLAVDIARERVAALREDFSHTQRHNIEGQFTFGIALLGQLGLQNLFYQSILSLRTLKMFGLSPVTNSGESWSFAKAVDEKINSIKPEILKEFVKGYLGGVENAFWDTGYIVSMGLDDIWRMDEFRSEVELGENKAVRVNPEP